MHGRPKRAPHKPRGANSRSSKRTSGPSPRRRAHARGALAQPRPARNRAADPRGLGTARPPPPRGQGPGTQRHSGVPSSQAACKAQNTPRKPPHTASAARAVGGRVAKRSLCPLPGPSETRTLQVEMMRGCDPRCSPTPRGNPARRGPGYSPDQRAQRQAGDQGQGPPVLLHLLLLLPPARRRHILPAAATAEAKMEEPEQEREDGSERPKGCGAGGAAPRRPACRPPSPRGPRRRRRGRFRGRLRGLPLLPRPPARPRPPPPAAAAAATATPCPPRPPRLSLRAAGDQRPQRTRRPTANHRRGRDTSHTAELEAAASPTSQRARTPPRRAPRGPRPLRRRWRRSLREEDTKRDSRQGHSPAHLQSCPVSGSRPGSRRRAP